MADRETKERKLFSLLVNDLEASLSESEVAATKKEVGALPDEELDRTLATRLDLPYPTDDETLERALARIAEPENLSGERGFTGAPDMSHDPRPEERGD